MDDPIMTNANKLNTLRLSNLLLKKRFNVRSSFDRYYGRDRTFLVAYKNSGEHAFMMRDWTRDIELQSEPMGKRLYIVPTLIDDLRIVQMLVEECWEG